MRIHDALCAIMSQSKPYNEYTLWKRELRFTMHVRTYAMEEKLNFWLSRNPSLTLTLLYGVALSSTPLERV